MRNLIKLTTCVIGVLLVARAESFAAPGTSLPPIGQRVYVIGTDGGKSPIAIYRDKSGVKSMPSQGAKVLRDPNGKITKTKVEPIVTTPKGQPKVSTVRDKAGSMRFKKVTIPGAISRPRVDFAQEPLRLERADEAVSAEFFDKIFIPARDENR
jgi:hypothetical protein